VAQQTYYEHREGVDSMEITMGKKKPGCCLMPTADYGQNYNNE